MLIRSGQRIFDEAASPPLTDGSLVFTRRSRKQHGYSSLLTEVATPLLYWNSRATSDHTVLTEVAGSTRNIPYSNRHPHRTCSAPFWVTFSISTAGHFLACHGPATASKLPLLRSGPPFNGDSLVPPESKAQTASRSVQPFFAQLTTERFYTL